MKRHALWAVAAGLMLAAGGAQDDAKQELKKLEGAWQVTALEADGQKLPDDEVKKIKVVIEGDKYSLKTDDNVVSRGTIKIDPTKKPKTIDVTPAEGDNVGQAMLGIYEQDGETWKTCYAQPGQKRPTKFAAEAASGQTVIACKKEKR